MRLTLVGGLLLLTLNAQGQKPVAELPRVYIDTGYRLPVGGKTWAVHDATHLEEALAQSAPGDVIVLDAGVTYAGNFKVPARENPDKKWTYVISSQLAKLPEGTRVGPSNSDNMPHVVSSNAVPVFDILGGADHWRFAGLEMTETYSPSNLLFGNYTSQAPLPDSIFIDRCYIHGLPTASIHRAILANITNFAIVDSHVADIQGAGVETQAVAAWASPGPFKIGNNFLSASTENVMFGGAGGWKNPYVPSDIEIRNNHFFKPLSWVGNPIAAVKNLFELKSAQRVLFDGNTLENVWVSAQVGYAVMLTVMTSQSGDSAVVNDLTITNNVLKNVVSGFDMLGADWTCGPPHGVNCHSAGSQDRWYIANNLILFYDPKLPGGGRNTGIAFLLGRDQINGKLGVPRGVVFQHNTMVSAASTPCWQAVLFSSGGLQAPPPGGLTNSLWLLDNVLCRQPAGEWGAQGTATLRKYMGEPNAATNDLNHRFTGNVVYVPPGDSSPSLPPHNLTTSKALRFVDPGAGNFELLEPKWTQTTDGKPAGIDFSTLPK